MDFWELIINHNESENSTITICQYDLNMLPNQSKRKVSYNTINN